MKTSQVDRVARAVLYEGYLLYPYRSSSIKNRQRWTFGGLVPRSHSLATGETEPWAMQTECLVAGRSNAELRIQVRFLHLLQRTFVGGSDPSSIVGREEAVEREVTLPPVPISDLSVSPYRVSFAFHGRNDCEAAPGPSGAIAVENRQEAVEGIVQVEVERLEPEFFRVRVRVENRTACAATPARGRDFASTHAILYLDGPARFLSLIDPPSEHRAAATACRNVGCWPVLAGEPGEQEVVLAAPIILYDYPQVAPESPGDLFDGTEIDEILTLRVLTLTDAEREEIRVGDARGRELLERTEALGTDQLLALHGALRNLDAVPKVSPLSPVLGGEGLGAFSPVIGGVGLGALFSPLSPVLGGEGLGVRGNNLSTQDFGDNPCAPSPQPSPPSTGERELQNGALRNPHGPSEGSRHE